MTFENCCTYISLNFKSTCSIIILLLPLTLKIFIIMMCNLICGLADQNQINYILTRSILDAHNVSKQSNLRLILNKNPNGSKLIPIDFVPGKMSQPYTIEYSASKHALEGFFGGLRLEFTMTNKDIAITMYFRSYR